MSGTVPSSALRVGSRTWQALYNNAGGLQRRCLSSSTPRQAVHVVTFTKSASPELQEILDTIREKIILPSYLPEDQRKRLYNHKYKKQLQVDPITLEIDGQLHKFKYVDMMRDLPNTHDVVTRALNAMKTPSDFANLPRLLEGVCSQAHRKLNGSLYPKMVRRAAMADCLTVVIDCAKQVKRTGFKLDSSETINELLVWIQKGAIDSNWDKKTTQKALKRTQQILDLLEEDENHQPKEEVAVSRAFPFYRDPQMLAARLHMAAALAVKHHGGKDLDGGLVAKYAQELVQLWPEETGLLELHPTIAYADSREGMRYLLERNGFVWYASPILSGLRMAAQVVEPELAQQLKKRAAAVGDELQTALAVARKSHSTQRGVALYNKLFNPQASSEVAATEEA
ncbi:hypothetical protein QBC46DRAFT_309465 [Diplogelasinospora grovesii]|uniref:Uncharacterized protein n=1 Tax=Diplogelasinospora grovesii TaxID=303347 RepID=A0AAN6NCC9_9PEZI|nr:hypothetical protein QBC46DRAFT_309465 [Diplogelasinospora grovesii]